jgi:hypothetical protein
VITDSGGHYLANEIDGMLTTQPLMRQPTSQGLEDFVDSLTNHVVYS